MESPIHSRRRLLSVDDVQRAQHHSRGIRRGMFVVGGGWIGAALGSTEVYGKSWLTGRGGGRMGVDGVGADGLAAGAHCTKPSPLSCAGESVLADHRRRTDGRTDRQDLYHCRRVRRLLSFRHNILSNRVVHVDEVFSSALKGYKENNNFYYFLNRF